MDNPKTTPISDLFESFKAEYDKQNSLAPFSNTNLFSTIHLSENDHTNILWDIIRYRKNGQYRFLNSFISDCLGLHLQMSFEDLEPKATQYQALANNDEKKSDNVGYIDLLLKDKNYALIIENKVCDASDGKNQLVRYYYTFAAFNDDEDKLSDLKVTASAKETKFTEDDNIYIVYLTKDDSKIFPEENTNSLPDFLKNRLRLNGVKDNTECVIPSDSHYIHISYSENVLSWLKDHVLPEISAYNSNEFYVAFYYGKEES